MNAEPISADMDGESYNHKRPNRRLAILIGLSIVAVALMILPRPSLYYPNVVIDAIGGMRLEFLLNGRQDKVACEAASASIANAVTSNCKDCRTRVHACIKNPSAELRRRFEEGPLSVPSARMANGGIVTYYATQADLALVACQESERQAEKNGDQFKVSCFPAGVERPRTAFEKQQDLVVHTTYTLLLAIVGGIIASLVAAIAVTHARHRKSQATITVGTATIQVAPIHPWLEKFVLAGVDALILLCTFLALSWPATDDINRWSRLDRASVFSYGIVIVLTIGWFWLLLEHYTRRRPFWDELREIFRVLAIMFMVSGAAAFVAGLETGRSSHLIVWGLNFLLIPLGRASAKQLLDDFGLLRRPAIIIGMGDNARDAYLAISSERGMGYKVLGFVSAGTHKSAVAPKSLTIGAETIPILDHSLAFDDLFTTLGNPQIILALDSLSDQENQTLVQRLLITHSNIHIIPSIRGLPLFGTQLSHFFSHEVLFLTVRNNLSRRGYIWIKRLFDLGAASFLLIVLSPLFAIVTYLIRSDGGIAIYGHTRVGRNGQLFKCLKFRSMRPDADKVLEDLLANDPVARAEWDKNYKLKKDPRVTPIGEFLRKTSLDELPQLINVIAGEMSIVGPRPIVTAELERYGEHVSLYLQVLPGMTGLWQISGRSDTSYSERVTLDAWYAQNWSLWYDIAILFKTINVVLNRRGSY